MDVQLFFAHVDFKSLGQKNLKIKIAKTHGNSVEHSFHDGLGYFLPTNFAEVPFVPYFHQGMLSLIILIKALLDRCKTISL